MSQNEQKGLQRIDAGGRLPAGFDLLSKEEQESIIRRVIDQDITLHKELKEKIDKSNIAENDLAVSIDTVRRLDDERKVYSHHVKGETGSGTYDLQIKGGDIKFIVPILVVIGIIILGIILIFALR